MIKHRRGIQMCSVIHFNFSFQESFYTPGFKDHPASGYLEIRLRNVRRTLGLSSPKSATKKAAAVESSIQIGACIVCIKGKLCRMATLT